MSAPLETSSGDDPGGGSRCPLGARAVLMDAILPSLPGDVQQALKAQLLGPKVSTGGKGMPARLHDAFVPLPRCALSYSPWLELSRRIRSCESLTHPRLLITAVTLLACYWLQASTINFEDALITLQLVLAKMQVSRFPSFASRLSNGQSCQCRTMCCACIMHCSIVVLTPLLVATLQAKELQPRHLAWPSLAACIALLADMSPDTLKARTECGFSHRSAEFAAS